MPEKKIDFPRHWVEFADPEDSTNIFRCDLTWLTSRWTCIWGQGCKGIDKDSPDVGCCTYGAHMADKEDEKKTRTFAKQLTPEIWQNYEEGRANGFMERDADGDKKTRAINGACIFHNRGGFSGGDGCALHILALQQGKNPIETKPWVCWQLPIRRTFEEQDRGDGSKVDVVVISEFNRRGWGAGGKDLDWYCSTATEAHIASKAVYESYEAELIELMGQKAYQILKTHCQAREVTLAAAQNMGDRKLLKVLAAHPADPKPAPTNQ